MKKIYYFLTWKPKFWLEKPKFDLKTKMLTSSLIWILKKLIFIWKWKNLIIF